MSFSWLISGAAIQGIAENLGNCGTLPKKSYVFWDNRLNADFSSKDPDKNFLAYISHYCVDGGLKEIIEKLLENNLGPGSFPEASTKALFKDHQAECYKVICAYAEQRVWFKFLRSAGYLCLLASLSLYALEQLIKGEPVDLLFAYCTGSVPEEIESNDKEGYNRIKEAVKPHRWFNWICRPISGRIAYWVIRVWSWIPAPIPFVGSLYWVYQSGPIFLPFGSTILEIIFGVIVETSCFIAIAIILLFISINISGQGINYYTDWDNGKNQYLRWLAMLASEGNEFNSQKLEFYKVYSDGKGREATSQSKKLLEGFMTRKPEVIPYGTYLNAIGSGLNTLQITPKIILENEGNNIFKQFAHDDAVSQWLARLKLDDENKLSFAIMLKLYNEISGWRWFNFGCLNHLIAAPLVCEFNLPCCKKWMPMEICLLRGLIGWTGGVSCAKGIKFIIIYVSTFFQQLFGIE